MKRNAVIFFLNLSFFFSCIGDSEFKINSPQKTEKHSDSELSKVVLSENRRRVNRIRALESCGTAIKIITKEQSKLKGYDNTILALKVLEETNCHWEFYAFFSNIIPRYRYYENVLFKAKFKYHKLESSDYKNASTNTIIKFSDLTYLSILDEFLVSPVNGKRKYSKYSPKKLLMHKHLPVRNGCFLKMKMPKDDHRLFREDDQRFFVSHLIVPSDEENIYVALINQKNGDRLFLKNDMDVALEHLWDKHFYIHQKRFKSENPKEILEQYTGFRRLKYYLYYAGTFSEIGLLAGVIAGLGYGISELADDGMLPDANEDLPPVEEIPNPPDIVEPEVDVKPEYSLLLKQTSTGVTGDNYDFRYEINLINKEAFTEEPADIPIGFSNGLKEHETVIENHLNDKFSFRIFPVNIENISRDVLSQIKIIDTRHFLDLEDILERELGYEQGTLELGRNYELNLRINPNKSFAVISFNFIEGIDKSYKQVEFRFDLN